MVEHAAVGNLWIAVVRSLAFSIFAVIFHFTRRYPAATFIFSSTVQSSPLASVFLAVCLAIGSTEVIWRAALQFRDVQALKHLLSLVQKADRIKTYSLKDFLPTLRTKNKHSIINLSNYPTYAAIQYEKDASYIIVNFRPSNQNDFRTFWLLHECGHIGVANQTYGLSLETGRMLGIAIMSPVVFLAFPGPLLVVVISIIGGFLSAVSISMGRLRSEIEADYSAVTLALQTEETARVLKNASLSPPQDRKLRPEQNIARHRAFQAMLADARDHGKLRDFAVYLGSDMMMAEISLGLPLLIFVISTGIWSAAPASFDIVAGALLAASLATLFGMATGKRALLAKLAHAVGDASKHPPTAPVEARS